MRGFMQQRRSRAGASTARRFAGCGATTLATGTALADSMGMCVRRPMLPGAEQRHLNTIGQHPDRTSRDAHVRNGVLGARHDANGEHGTMHHDLCVRCFHDHTAQ